MSSRTRKNIPALVLEPTDDLCVMRRRSLPSPRPAPPSGHTSASDTVGSWTSGACPLTSQLSFCSSDSFASFSRISFKTPEPALSESESTLPSSSFLLDLQLSAEDIMTGSHSIPMSYREPQWELGEDDLSLSSPSSPTLGPAKVINALTWAATSQTSVSGDLADKQPWRQYWPPPLGTSLFTWVASERPDVLSFSFDPNNHLLHQNHPWQAWKDEHPAVTEDSDDEDVLDISEISSSPSGIRRETRLLPEPQPMSKTHRIRDELDDLIQVDLQLPSVIPKQFNYLRPLRRYRKERPYRLQLPAGLVPIPVTNVFAKSYPVRIYDVSGHEDKFALDVSGFQFIKCPIAVGEWNDQAIIKSYLPALLDWVVDLLGGESGLVYSFNFRHHSFDHFVPVQRPWGMRHNPLSPTRPPPWDDDDSEDDECYSINRYLGSNRRDDPYNSIYAVKADPGGPCHWKKPLFRVHCDASENTHKQRLPILQPDTAEKLMSGRVRQVSVWRKLSECTQDTPLALCDARTVDREDLVPMDVVYPHFADEVYEVYHNKNHRWFYNKGMENDDVVIFKLHDTHDLETVCPHGAFVDPSVPSDTPPRLSIEAKIMVFGG